MPATGFIFCPVFYFPHFRHFAISGAIGAGRIACFRGAGCACLGLAPRTGAAKTPTAATPNPGVLALTGNLSYPVKSAAPAKGWPPAVRPHLRKFGKKCRQVAKKQQRTLPFSDIAPPA